MSAARERLLDVSALEAPEPLFAALDAVDALAPGEYLRLRHRREPHPLYAHLLERGCAWRVLDARLGAYEALIWRNDDACAVAACAAPEEDG